jgi:hypothetical protein
VLGTLLWKLFLILLTTSLKISSDAKQATLRFINLSAVVIDAAGQRYFRSLDAERALEWAEGKSTPFEQPVGPRAAFSRKSWYSISRPIPRVRPFF